MALTVNAKTYSNDVPRGSDSYRYLGTAHTASKADYIDLYRTSAPEGDEGKVKSKGRAKLTRGVTNGTSQLATDLIFDCNCMVPTGTASAEIDSALNDLGAWIASAAFKSVVKNGTINQ